MTAIVNRDPGDEQPEGQPIRIDVSDRLSLVEFAHMIGITLGTDKMSRGDDVTA